MASVLRFACYNFVRAKHRNYKKDIAISNETTISISFKPMESDIYLALASRDFI
jgi:hypothetical protein